MKLRIEPSGSPSGSYECRNDCPSKFVPRNELRSPITIAMLRAKPHSGRTCAQSFAPWINLLRAISAVAASGIRWWANLLVTSAKSALSSRSSSESSPNNSICSVVVLCCPAKNLVESGITIPRTANSNRTCGSFSICASTTALGLPACAAHAPHSKVA